MTINTVRGAQASAIIYSITETARANNLNVYYYIKHVLTELPQSINKNGKYRTINAAAIHAMVKNVTG